MLAEGAHLPPILRICPWVILMLVPLPGMPLPPCLAQLAAANVGANSLLLSFLSRNNTERPGHVCKRYLIFLSIILLLFSNEAQRG